MKRLLVPVLLLFLLLAGGSTSSRFTDSAQIGPNTFTAAAGFPIQTQPLSALKVGSRLVDRNLTWEYNYIDGKVTKPIVWILVAMDHYSYVNEEHTGVGVMLLAEEIVKTDLFGDNRWEDSAARNWFNNDFYESFPDEFRNAVIETLLPNRDVDDSTYTTIDNVFCLSMTELGFSPLAFPSIGRRLEYFLTGVPNKRKAAFGVQGYIAYWTRTLEPKDVKLWLVTADGLATSRSGTLEFGYRPALNLKGDTPVTVEPGPGGIYEILWPENPR
ncbi:MAG: hypothetical protein GX973_04715 [Firmicutes bacterium]|nr:hypothetical protein [Bacillota bacterium]